MLSAVTLAACLYLAGNDGDVTVLPSGRLSLGVAGRFDTGIGPLFAGQLLGGFGVVMPVAGDFGIAIVPQLGGGFDISDRFISSYMIVSGGLMFGNLHFALGYHPGFIAGTDRVRGDPIIGFDRLRGTHGFHHTLEVRGPFGFWGFEVQHDVFVQPELRHGLRVLFVLEVPIGLMLGMIGENVSFGGF